MKNDVGEKLGRLLEVLKQVGVEHGSRNRTVAEKIGYSEKSVANILSGNATLSDRFIKIVCRSFDVEDDYVLKGDENIEEVHIERLNRLVNSPQDLRNIALKLRDVWDELIDEERIFAASIMLKHIRNLKRDVEKALLEN